MPIQSGDVKLLKSAVMADVPEAAARHGPRDRRWRLERHLPRTSRNWIAPEAGSTCASLRAVATDDTDTYFGANVIVAEPPQDARVSVTLFSTERPSTPASRRRPHRGLPQQRAPSGRATCSRTTSRASAWFSSSSAPPTPLPNVGQTLVLIENEGCPRRRRYIRATGVGGRAHLHLQHRPGLQGGGRHGRHQRRAALRLHRIARDARTFTRANNAPRRRHGGGDAGTYVGVVPLTQAANVGDFTLKGASIYTQLVPAPRPRRRSRSCRRMRQRALPVPGAAPVSYGQPRLDDSPQNSTCRVAACQGRCPSSPTASRSSTTQACSNRQRDGAPSTTPTAS